MNETIGFIGGGNMAASLIGGLLAAGHPATALRVSDPAGSQRDRLSQRFGVTVSADNPQIAAAADVLVLAVKPQQMRAVAGEIGEVARTRRPLLISIAAGVTEPAISGWLGDATLPVVRCMPNTPSLLGCGATGLYANARVTPAQRQIAETVLATAGVVTWVEDEALLDAVTAVSGSGPAYFFFLMEQMIAAGVELGLTPEQARLLTLQTALGAARMALENDDGAPPDELRRRVTSPGGTTERALDTLRQGGFEALVGRALQAAAERCRELNAELQGGA